jgi:lipoprotein NlpI
MRLLRSGKMPDRLRAIVHYNRGNAYQHGHHDRAIADWERSVSQIRLLTPAAARDTDSRSPTKQIA